MPDAAGGHPATSPLALPVVATPTDDRLIASARAGDGFAVTRLWHRHEPAAAAAAGATPGSADVEFVVEAAAARFSAWILAPAAPVGAMRPHVLAAVREAAAAADGRGGTTLDHVPALVAPAEWYAADLPAGLDDGEAVAVAFTSLGTAAQEALWLTEIDGLPPVELAAELALTPAETEALVATTHAGIRDAWIRQRAAAVPAGGDCDGALAELGAPGAPGRRIPGRVRAHVGTCDGCRAAALPAAELAHRLVGLVPLLVLGGASGVAFLEATRAGSSAAVVAPIPALEDRRTVLAAMTAGAIAGTTAAATSGASPASAASSGFGTGVAQLARSVARVPRSALLATSATLAAAAAAVVVVAAISGGTPGLGSLDSAVGADGGAADISAAPPGVAPPEIVSTDLPAEPRPTPDGGGATTPPTDASPDAAAPDGSSSPDGAAAPSVDDPTTGGDPSTPPQPEPGSPPAPPPGDGVSTPIADPAKPSAGLSFTVGEPGDAGWRPLTVTGPAGAEFTIFDDGSVLIQGVLDGTGTANFAVRGSVNGLTIGYSSTSVTAGGSGSTGGTSAKSSGVSGPGRGAGTQD
ncbi:hypothetical protein [Agromyces kandeliae]|uniref:Uncharacterized protein n=1 Tax=Agromyces kandeliae TaxID=2666141 RepID=A0A6L5R1F0_9MICO|nr:hypothetical protein [Agromyces kandeliae]MRX43881.1 hypothetical protein [Agromyces kandeliae]